MYLQHNIAFIRKYKRLTYKEFAEVIGCTEAQAKTYELRGVSVSYEGLIAIADFAGVTVDTLLKIKLSEKNYIEFREPFIGIDKGYALQMRINLVIKTLFKERAFGKYTQTEMRRILNLTQTQFDNIINRDEEIPVNASLIMLLVEHFNVNANWLLVGEGPWFNDVSLAQGYQKLKEELKLVKDKLGIK